MDPSDEEGPSVEALDEGQADNSFDVASDGLERKLDEALAEDDSRLIPDLNIDPEHSELPSVEDAASSKAAPPSDKCPASVPVVSGREHQSTPKLNEVAFDMWARQKRACALRLPWERNVAAKVFGFKEPKTLELPQIGCNVSLASETPPLGSEFAKKRLRVSSMIRSEDQVRWEALRKIKVLLMINPESSFLGATLADKAILDSFADKRTGTLIKRASSCWRFVQWVIQQGHPNPLLVGEAVFYAYMGHLRDHGASTTATCFIESWTVLFHVAGLKTPPLGIVLSPRVRGAAKDMFASKRKLVQAVPLTVRMVLALEQVVQIPPHDHWKIIAGHLLFCLGASSRFADSLHLDSLIISKDEASGLSLVEADTGRYKTGDTNERSLPLLSLGQFFGVAPWAELWINLRSKYNLPTSPALPAFSEVTNQWLSRPMSTGEASLYLKEMLTGSGFDREAVQQMHLALVASNGFLCWHRRPEVSWSSS